MNTEDKNKADGQSRNAAAKERFKLKSLVPYSILFDLYPNALLIEDTKGTILDVNDIFCQNLGYSKNELIGKHIKIIVPKEESDKVEQNINKIRNERSMFHAVKNLKKDGSICWMELKEILIPLTNGNYGILVVSNDVSDRGLLEEAWHESEDKFRAMTEHLSDEEFHSLWKKFLGER